MRTLLLAALLFVAACAPRPAVMPAPVATAPGPSSVSQPEHRSINGMTAHELVQLYGRPKLQIVEGEGTKLQFAGANCVLDVYLYPPPSGGAPRATLIEARNGQGNDVSAQACAASIQNR